MGYFSALSNHATIPSLSSDRLGRIPIPLPRNGVQIDVVAFLDREFAKTDALIGKQEQLIATLREDRSATITHAATKGLEPTVEMKDSGEEWIGLVPRHWSVTAVKHLAGIFVPDRDKPELHDDGAGW
jgi:type I restriction enzyme, S subunit